jgi:hypothetical protein
MQMDSLQQLAFGMLFETVVEQFLKIGTTVGWKLKDFDLPHSVPLLSNDSSGPFSLHGDEAFPLQKYLVRPCKQNSDINTFAAPGFLI